MNEVYIDGSCNQSGVDRQERKGRYCIVFPDGQRIIKECIAHSNNEAEYSALIAALQDERVHDCTIITDSMLVYGHCILGWKINAENLRPFHEQALKLLAEKHCKLKWMRREKNAAGKEIEFVQQKTNSMFWSD